MKTTTAKMLLTAILLAAIVLGSAKAKETDERRERLFAYYSTTSVTRLTTTTITGLKTCLSTAQTLVPKVPGDNANDPAKVPFTARAPDCQGRRKRTLPRPIEADLIDLQVDGSKLDGTLDETFEAHEMEKGEVLARDGKILTIWSTNFNVITITSTSILPLTTITVRAVCFYPSNLQMCF